MTTIETVLVPLDGSEFSHVAVSAAARLAARLDAAIHLLSAVESVDEMGDRDKELASLGVPGDRVARTVVVDRDPAGAIHETLRKSPGAVVCMATHGRGRSTAVVGSVATDLLTRGHDAVVLVCPYIDQAPRAADVVVCVDDSPDSAELVTVGVEWADRLGERLVVLTVAEEMQDPLTGEAPRRRFGPDGDVERFLEELVQPARAAGHAVDTRALYNPIGVWHGLYRH
jgi:nucleotide-binding universal stress UspA family protein